VERARLEGGVELEEAASEEVEAEEDGEGTGEAVDGEQVAEVVAIERTSERETDYTRRGRKRWGGMSASRARL
jgi:hypothetical protein